MLPQARGAQIKPGSIGNIHIDPSNPIAEQNLAIDWVARAREVLTSRTVIDFVQVNDVTILDGASSIDITASISAPAAVSGDNLGAVVEDGKNLVILRSAVTGDPLVDEVGGMVYGKLTYDDVGEAYNISLFSKVDSIETPYAVDVDTVVDLQFPQRFTLADVSETFAANEKFTDGASDVSSRLDLEQIRLDVFGAGYQYDHDGQAQNPKTIDQRIYDLENAEPVHVPAPHAVVIKVVAEDGIDGTDSINFDGISYAVSNLSEMIILNGSILARVENYTHIVSGEDPNLVVGIKLTTPDLFQAGDVIQARWTE